MSSDACIDLTMTVFPSIISNATSFILKASKDYVFGVFCGLYFVTDVECNKLNYSFDCEVEPLGDSDLVPPPRICK